MKTPWQGRYFRARRLALRLSMQAIRDGLSCRRPSPNGRPLPVPSLSGLYATLDGRDAPGPRPRQRWLIKACADILHCKEQDLWKP
jgi:hypothetical protein